MVKQTPSSRRWLKEHEADPFVKKARELGYRSRAAFKIEGLDRQDKLFRRGMTVVDLGASPGGWSQIAAKRVAPGGRIFACDCLPMAPLSGVEFVEGDLTDPALVATLLARIGPTKADLVLSDLAPSMSGIKSVDQARAFELTEIALEVAVAVLAPGGTFVVKLFHGEGYEAYYRQLRQRFSKVSTRKPEASRDRSAEVYAVARSLKP
jgi:23S rRNA (uridine2552-2'-O)-methyltransferase